MTHWVIKGDMTDNSAEILFQSVWGVSRDPLPVCKGCQQRCSSSLYGVSAEILFQSVWGVSRDALPVCMGCQQRCSSNLYGVSAEILFQSVWGVSRDPLPVCMGCPDRDSTFDSIIPWYRQEDWFSSDTQLSLMALRPLLSVLGD